MTDYIYVFFHLPLYIYEVGVFLWHLIYNLPWPSWSQYFTTLVLFVCLYKPRQWLEARVLRKTYRRTHKKTVATTSDQQSITAVVGDMVHHL